ncbi:anthranilate synthase component I family protein [Lysobacter sp. HDW10]|uniref:anthranilate synthase component I family protein n=1 Tax=Lysobacter sp. HDW10 TaxID=2714936 RepID=UPI00140A24AF|nr:anthranilate synthase component I family protein [Lysobacter sp. HDW10]QIK80697.1 anthranilate synthase component I family protein [Lysobacter sp. HDW10]
MLLRYRLPADLITPLGTYLALRSHGASLLLESADQGERVGRHSFVLLEGEGEVQLAMPATGWVQALRDLAGPLDASRGELMQDSELADDARAPMPTGVGIAGYVGFEALAANETTIGLPTRNSFGLPSVYAKRFDAAVVFDHLHQVAEIQVRADTHAHACEKIRQIRIAVYQPVLPRDDAGQPTLHPLISRNEFKQHVRDTLQRIKAGDVYQLVPSQRLRVDAPPSPLTAYRRMRRLNPSPYGFLLEWDAVSLAGASPEMLVRVAQQEAETLPIAGTVTRGANDAEDRARFEALIADKKELAEHQMLVDLARNDLGRVARPGGVRVENPLALQRTSHVLHITTTVKATLQPDLDALDVLASAFPAGTVSGAPKIRAAQRIREMEDNARGPYGGALIRLSPDGALDSALILRTAIYANGSAWLQAGAGIVRASDPEAEYLETLHKMAAPAQALGVSLAGLMSEVSA